MSLPEFLGNTLWHRFEAKSINSMTFNMDRVWQKGQNRYQLDASEQICNEKVPLLKMCHIICYKNCNLPLKW